MSEAEELIEDDDDDEGKAIGRIGDCMICEIDNSILCQMTKEETEMWAKAMEELAAALKKRGKTLEDLM